MIDLKKLGQLTVSLLMIFGCGTFIGNPDGVDENQSMTISISSAEFDPQMKSLMLSENFEFAFCVKQLKFKVEGSDSDNLKNFRTGLVNVSNGLANNWGDISLLKKTKIREIQVLAKRDQDLCQVSYSVLYNGKSSDKTVVFRWKFDPSIEIDQSTYGIELSLESVLRSLKNSSGNGQTIRNKIESVFGSGKKQARDVK